MTKPLSERLYEAVARLYEDGMDTRTIADLLREASALARRVEESEWIACSDKLPGPCDHVEVFPNTHEPQTFNFYAHFNGGTNGVKAGNWYHNDEAGYYHIITPTHWRLINRDTSPSTEAGEV